jgi:leucine dehydrogenase
MGTLFEALQAGAAERCLALSHAPSGLRAFLVLDDLTLGPAAGGVRTMRYPTAAAALQDAMQLARAMTIKCALAGLDAGGGKAVILEQYLTDRPRAFERLGEITEELGGLFRTAGDIGTTAEDLAAMARKTQFVHTNEADLCLAVARGLRRCLETCIELHGGGELCALRIAVQGAGSIGAAVATDLARAGARVFIADLDTARAQSLAKVIGAEAVAADSLWTMNVDVISPCAAGGVLTVSVARGVKAWAVCGAANNIPADDDAERTLIERRVLYVPDVIASAGAVIDGIGASVMNLTDRGPLIDRLGCTARAVLSEAHRRGKLPTEVAEAMARRRIEAAGQA